MTARRPHWSLAGWRKTRPDLLFRNRSVGGPAHVGEVYRVLRVGPWSIWLLRYRPGYAYLEDGDQ